MGIVLILIYIFIGLIAGLMSGIFGIGGGSVRIPLLNLAGLDLITAFAINLFVIPFSSFMGAITHKKNINKKVAIYVIIGGTLGSVTGALFTGLLSKLILSLLFIASAIITVFAIHLDKIMPKLSQKIHPTKYHFIGFSFLLNLITGLRGGSGGSLFPPFLKAMRLNIREAIATSLLVTIFTALSAFIVYWQRSNIVWSPALLVLTGSIIGSRAGSKLSMKTEPKWLETGLSVLIVLLALVTLFKAI